METPVHDVVVESVMDVHQIDNRVHTNDLVTFNITDDASSTHHNRLTCNEVNICFSVRPPCNMGYIFIIIIITRLLLLAARPAGQHAAISFTQCSKNGFLPRDAMHRADYAVARCVSVCLSHAGIVWKRLNIS